MPRSPDAPLDDLYGDMIIDHYRTPRHSDPVPAADLEAEEDNPFCGDRVTIRLKLDGDGRIAEVGFQTEGCSIIKATASMMAEALRWKTLEQVDGLARRFRERQAARREGRGVTGRPGGPSSGHAVSGAYQVHPARLDRSGERDEELPVQPGAGPVVVFG